MKQLTFITIILGIFISGCVPIRRLHEKDVELAVLKEDLRLADQDKERVTGSQGKRLAELKGRNETLEEENTKYAKKIHILNRDIELLNLARINEVNKVKDTYDDFVSKLRDEVDKGNIEIEQLKDRISVKMLDKILFNPGIAEINDKGKEMLAKVGALLKDVKGKSISVEGHTDNVKIIKHKDKFPSNWELSAARAINVVKFMQEIVGIDPAKLSAVAFGQNKPVADNKTVKNRAKNRRIEIILVPVE